MQLVKNDKRATERNWMLMPNLLLTAHNAQSKTTSFSVVVKFKVANTNLYFLKNITRKMLGFYILFMRDEIYTHCCCCI